MMNTSEKSEPHKMINTQGKSEPGQGINTCTESEPFVKINTCTTSELAQKINTLSVSEPDIGINTESASEPAMVINTWKESEPTNDKHMLRGHMMNEDRQAIKMLVRAREDFQSMRKRMDNRIGRKANGKDQNIEQRVLRPEDVANFSAIADAAKDQEKAIEKMLVNVLKRFPIYNGFLKETKGVGTIAAGWIIGEFDIHIATTVSKLWQFAGLNPGMVIGKKREENKDGSFSYIPTKTLIRGDKMTPGFVAPFNKRLRTALVGVMADGFIKALIRYEDATPEEYEQAPESFRRMKKKIPQVICTAESYGKMYLEYKERLRHEKSEVTHLKEDIPWKEVSDGHRDRAAKRYITKMFLKDLYVAWRGIEGLKIRAPYQEAYLGHKHE